MEKYGTVNNGSLNLRDKPSTDSTILAQLAQNAVLEILADAGFGWLQVRVQGTQTTGYVSKVYLTLTDTPPVQLASPLLPAPTSGSATTTTTSSSPVPSTSTASTTSTAPTVSTVPAPAGTKGEVNIASLNLRSGPATTFDVVTKLSQNTLLDILATQGDWLHVQVDGQTQQGYVSSQYVTLNPISSTTPTTSTTTSSSTPISSTPTSGTAPVTVASGYLASQPDLMNATLVPDKLIPQQSDNSAAILARTWNSFGGLVGKVAGQLGITPDTVIAVLSAESGGRTNAADGRIIIRFENHIFYQYWGKSNEATYDQYFNFDRSAPANSWKGHQWRADPSASWQSFHGNQDMEYTVLNFARKLNDSAALMSISMGAPQIMGFNFKRLGYSNVQDMFTNFQRSPHAQLLAMFDFVHSPATIQALQSRDYVAFATIYNGSANAQTYGGIIQNYSALYNRLIATAS